jgi:hypothetical protein
MPKKWEKTLREMPNNAKRTLFHLVNDIRETGTVRPEYHNYRKLDIDLYHSQYYAFTLSAESSESAYLDSEPAYNHDKGAHNRFARSRGGGAYAPRFPKRYPRIRTHFPHVPNRNPRVADTGPRDGETSFQSVETSF